MSNRLPLLLIVLAGCGGAKRAAEQAVASADSAVATIQAEAERVAPELLQPLQASVANAREAIAGGQFEAATAGVKDIPARVTETSAKLEQAKKDLSADFATLSVAVPRNLDAIGQKLAKPPRSLSRERLAELQKTYDDAMVEWPAITQEFQGGMIASAMGKAFALKARMSEAMVSLGVSSGEKEWGNLITQPQ